MAKKKVKRLTKQEVFRKYNCGTCPFAPFNPKAEIHCEAYNDEEMINELCKEQFCSEAIKLHKKIQNK